MTTKVFRLLPDGEPATGMQPSNFTDQNAFTTADKREVNHTFFQTEDGSTLSGVWECAPCREEIDAYPAHEMMTVLAGSVTLTNADGSARSHISTILSTARFIGTMSIQLISKKIH